jgi:F-type H+-transporting ATPase subunit 8
MSHLIEIYYKKINLKLLITQRQFSKFSMRSSYFNLMPQLIPFYFVNQFSFSFLTLLSLIYIFSKYVLPLFTFQQVIRIYITKLSNKS